MLFRIKKSCIANNKNIYKFAIDYKSMQKILLKFKSIEAKPEINKSNLRLFIRYEENGILKTSEKVLLADDSIEKFVPNFLRELKSSLKNKYSGNSDDILEGFVNVVIDESDEGESEEKIVNGLKRLRERLRGFKSIKSADNYMNKFYDMSKLEVKL